jgi:hypothetical protein
VLFMPSIVARNCATVNPGGVFSKVKCAESGSTISVIVRIPKSLIARVVEATRFSVQDRAGAGLKKLRTILSA